MGLLKIKHIQIFWVMAECLLSIEHEPQGL